MVAAQFMNQKTLTAAGKKKSIFAKFYGTQCSLREAAADMNEPLCVAAEWGFLPQSLRENIVFRKEILQTCFVIET